MGTPSSRELFDRILEEVKQKNRQQAAVAELGRLALEADLSVLMDEVTRVAAQTLEVEYCKILELLPSGDALRLRAGVGWKEGYVGTATVSAGRESQAGYTVFMGEPVIVEDWSTETRFEAPSLLRDHAIASGVSVVVGRESQPWGVLGVHATTPRKFTQDDSCFLLSVANLLAAAIERHEKNRALQDSEEAYRLLFEDSPLPTWVTDADGRFFLAVNRAAVEHYGYSADEFLQMGLTDIRPPEEVPRYVEFCRTRDRNNMHSGMWKHRRKGGALIDVEVFAVPSTWEGKPARIVLAKDITQQRRAEEMVLNIAKGMPAATGEQLFRALAAHLAKSLGGDYSFVGEILPGNPERARVIAGWANGQAAESFEYDLAGTPSENVAGKSPCSYPRDVQTLFPKDRWLAEMGVNGYSGTPLFDARGNALGLICVLFRDPIRDVVLVESMLQIFAVRAATELERRRDLELLRQSEERFQLVAQATNDTIWDLNLLTHEVWWNEGIEKQFGYSPAEVVPNYEWWVDRVHPEDWKSVELSVEVALAGTGRHWSSDYRFRRADGTYAFVHDRGIITRDETGKPVRMIGTMMDITERRLLEEHLLHVQKIEAIGQLAGGVAHDFNNLITAILGYSEMLEKRRGSVHAKRHYVSQINKAARQAASLTNQLLAFGRQQMLQPVVMDLDDVISDTHKMLQRLISKDVELNIVRALSPVLVKADPGQVAQVLMNLAINARDATPDGGRLTVESFRVKANGKSPWLYPTVPPGSYGVLAVSDTGVGMDSQTKRRIFEPFFTTKGMGKGTGLGLATVYGIVQQSGGHITVDSEPGRGATFRVFLPLFEEYATETRALAPRRKKTETVLLVEDEQLVRQSASECLQDAGYTVLEAGEASEAMQIWRDKRDAVHLLVTDVVMPGLDGPELAARLRAERPSLKVLYISGHADHSAGFLDAADADTMLLQKPFGEALLVRTVRRLIPGSWRRPSSVLRKGKASTKKSAPPAK